MDDPMEKKNNGFAGVLIFLAVIAALAAAAVLLFRTEKQVRRLLGALEGRLTGGKKSGAIRVELVED